jgi:hypothetical protein
MPLGVLSVLVVVLTILVVVQGLALLELVRQFAQLRQRLDFGDQPSAYPTPVGLQISVAPELLTSPIRRALESDQAALVLLSVSCLTCMNVASGWSRVERFSRQGFVLLPILHARSFQEAKRFIEATELQEKATVLDVTGLLSDAIGRQTGLNTRPVVVILEHGRLWSIDIVRSAQQLADVLARVCAREGVFGHNELDQMV